MQYIPMIPQCVYQALARVSDQATFVNATGTSFSLVATQRWHISFLFHNANKHIIVCRTYVI